MEAEPKAEGRLPVVIDLQHYDMQMPADDVHVITACLSAVPELPIVKR